SGRRKSQPAGRGASVPGTSRVVSGHGDVRGELSVRRCAIRASGRVSEHVVLPLRDLQENLRRCGYGERRRADGVGSAGGRSGPRPDVSAGRGLGEDVLLGVRLEPFGSGWPNSEVTSVRLSAIDTPFEQRPGGHIYVRSLAPWETLPEDGLERFDSTRD